MTSATLTTASNNKRRDCHLLYKRWG